MRIHHQDEYNVVVFVNSKGLSLESFTPQRKEPRVRTLFGNSSVRESPDNSPDTPSATPRPANGTGQLVLGQLDSPSLHLAGPQLIFLETSKKVC